LPPTNLKQLQAQLGLFNYYRGYVPNFNALAQPLYKLLQKGAEYKWSGEAQRSYDALKSALCTDGIALRQPVDSLPFHLYVDWSSTGIAAVLNQKDEHGREFMVACASRSLNAAEKNYPAWKGEMLAAVWGVKLLRPYLHSREFFLHTDHRALLWLLTHKNPVGQQMRWVLALQEYRFTLVHDTLRLFDECNDLRTFVIHIAEELGTAFSHPSAATAADDASSSRHRHQEERLEEPQAIVETWSAAGQPVRAATWSVQWTTPSSTAAAAAMTAAVTVTATASSAQARASHTPPAGLARRTHSAGVTRTGVSPLP
jgi:hypothetical protein